MKHVPDYDHRRAQLVDQIAARGVHDERILRAMRAVPREDFFAPEFAEFVYSDTPLPIPGGAVAPQPYVIAHLLELAEIEPHFRVLVVGAGSGYAAAVTAYLGAEVYAIERLAPVARDVEQRLADLDIADVHVRYGDETQGWAEAAPFDAIVGLEGVPSVPPAFRAQLALGAYLVLPVGHTPREQTVLRVTREGEIDYRDEDMGHLRFVPYVGYDAWNASAGEMAGVFSESASASASGEQSKRSSTTTIESRSETRVSSPAAISLVDRIHDELEAFDTIESARLDPLMARIGEARVVLLGESTHGTSEFYRMRARITRELIARKSFNIVAVEADWPDAARIDHYVRDRQLPAAAWTAFARFPMWMWRNEDMAEFVDWMRAFNQSRPSGIRKAGFYGLDLYSLYTAIGAVLEYLDATDPDAAKLARHRYGCLTPWEGDPAAYGRAVITDRYRSCERDATAMLVDLLRTRQRDLATADERLFDAQQNARLVADAEKFYRVMYFGGNAAWNLRDTHMFDTLKVLLDFHGPHAKAVVWAHNSHVGDASATELGARGETNLGELCRKHFGSRCYIVGFGTDRGTVAAASEWDGDVRIKSVLPSRGDSYERLCHDTGVKNFLLPLTRGNMWRVLTEPRLQRAIGVVYRPRTELQSHYFQTILPRQFDEYIWFDSTHAVRPLDERQTKGMPETWPFGL